MLFCQLHIKHSALSITGLRMGNSPLVTSTENSGKMIVGNKK